MSVLILLNTIVSVSRFLFLLCYIFKFYLFYLLRQYSFISHNNPSSSSHPSSSAHPFLFPFLSCIHFSQRVRPSMVSQQNLLEAESRSSPPPGMNFKLDFYLSFFYLFSMMVLDNLVKNNFSTYSSNI